MIKRSTYPVWPFKGFDLEDLDGRCHNKNIKVYSYIRVWNESYFAINKFYFIVFISLILPLIVTGESLLGGFDYMSKYMINYFSYFNIDLFYQNMIFDIVVYLQSDVLYLNIIFCFLNDFKELTGWIWSYFFSDIEHWVMLLVRKFGFITQAYASNTGSVNKAPSSQGWVDWFLTTISGWFGGVFGSTLSSVEPDLPRSYHDLFVLKDKYKSHVKDLVDRGSIGHLWWGSLNVNHFHRIQNLVLSEPKGFLFWLNHYNQLMVDLDELRVYRFKFDGCLDDRIIIELKRIECTILSGLQFINDSVNNQLDAFPAQWKVKFLQSGSVNKPTVNLMVESGWQNQIKSLRVNLGSVFQFYYNYYHQYSYNFESPPEMYFYRDGVFCKIGIKSEDVLFPPIYVFECNYQHILVGKAYLTYKLQGASPCYWRDVFFYKDSLVILNELSKELEYSIQHYVWSAKEASLFLAQCEKAGTAEDCGPLRDAYVFYGSVFKRLVLDSLDLLFEINKNYYSDQFSEEFYWLSCNVRDRIYISLNESLDLLRGCPFFRFACPSKDFDIKGFLGKQNLYEDKLRWNYYYLTPTEFQTQREEILRLSILELWFEYGDFTGLTLRDHFLFNNLIGSEKNNCLENNYSLSFDRDFLERKFMFKWNTKLNGYYNQTHYEYWFKQKYPQTVFIDPTTSFFNSIHTNVAGTAAAKALLYYKSV